MNSQTTYPPHEVEPNDSKHEKEVDEVSPDEEHTDDVALFEKPLIPTRPKEEIGTYSVLSKADYIDDLESPVDKTDKVAKLSPRAEIECDKQENGSNFKGKNKEQDKHEESRKDDTEKEDVVDESLENAYSMEVVQKDNSSSYCKKCEVNLKKQEKFRKHLIEGHKNKCA